MARLLGPTEFGLYALALPTISFLMLLADGGLGLSLSREPENGPIWSTAFWLLLAVGIGLAIFVSIWGEFLSALTHQPRLPRLMGALSISLIFVTLSVCPSARIARRGWVGAGATTELIATVLGAAAALLLAFNGAGAWSLVAQTLMTYGMRAIVINCVAFRAPRFEFRPGLLRNHLATGSYLLGGRMSDFGSRLIEAGLFSHFLGTRSLGLYTFANQVPRYVCESVGNITWDLLYVQSLRVEREKAVSFHLQICRILALILFPIAFLISGSAHELIGIFLGSKWSSAAPLLAILLPVYVFNAIANQSGAILLVNLRYNIQFFCTVGLSIGRILAVCTAPWFGLWGVALVIVFANAAYVLAMMVLPAPITGCNFRPVVATISGPLISSLYAGLACYAINLFESQSIFKFLISIIVGLLTYCCIICLVDRAKLSNDIKTILKLFLKRTNYPIE